MIEIKHKDTGDVLHCVQADSLRRANLAKLNLREADLCCADLHRADLHGTDLSQANLQHAFLRKTNLVDSILWSADLRGANLSAANLGRAWLFNANLQGADLAGASINNQITYANLRHANLTHTHLEGADLTGSDLTGAVLTGAVCKSTVFAACTGLHEAQGLDEVLHMGPSVLDLHTLRVSACHLPDRFLQGCGYTSEEIEYLRTFYSSPIQYYSCFLSHAGQDGEFADRLRSDLLDNSVSCWHYRYDMRGGGFWRGQINEAIKIHDKLILICSRRSVKRDNVVDEILQAMDRERQSHEQKLFPVGLDSYILGDKALEFGDEQVKKGVWPENWIRHVQRFHVPDFRRWKNHDAYQAEFHKLLRDLKQPAAR